MIGFLWVIKNRTKENLLPILWNKTYTMAHSDKEVNKINNYNPIKYTFFLSYHNSNP